MSEGQAAKGESFLDSDWLIYFLRSAGWDVTFRIKNSSEHDQC